MEDDFKGLVWTVVTELWLYRFGPGGSYILWLGLDLCGSTVVDPDAVLDGGVPC